MRNSVSLLVILFLTCTGGFSQCKPETIPFQGGEKITYIAAYNWGPVWVDAGEVTFAVENVEYRGQHAFHFRSTGTTYKSYDFLFKVRDYYDSWVNPNTFQSYDFKRQIYEGGYMLQNNMSFFPKLGIALSNTKRPDKPIKTDTLKLERCCFDMLASVYYVRSLDLRAMKEGEKLPVTVLIDDSIFRINVKKLGTEIKENRDGKKYSCIKLSATMVEGTIFRKDEDVNVWITDDENKIPIIVEAKILVGTVKAYLKKTEGLRYPVTSLIKK
jgi:hypothetical protein